MSPKVRAIRAECIEAIERDLAKVEVAGSSPVIRSKKFQDFGLGIFLSKPFALHDLRNAQGAVYGTKF